MVFVFVLCEDWSMDIFLMNVYGLGLWKCLCEWRLLLFFSKIYFIWFDFIFLFIYSIDYFGSLK